MIDPYENILIGNFLYSLGLVIGRHSPENHLVGAVNLLQQTPMDKALGDVLIGYPGVVRLIEFKRKSNKSEKEAIKRNLLEIALKKQPQLQVISRMVHWYVETEETPLEWTTRICPYIDFEKKGLTASTSFSEFTEQLAISALTTVEPEFPTEKVSLYFDTVATLSKKGSSSSGLLVSIDRKGALRYVAVESIRDLSLKLHHYQDKAQERRLQLTLEREQTKEISNQKGGHSLGRW